MLIVNTDYIAGKELEMLGMVQGSSAQGVHSGHQEYTQMMERAREFAIKHMIKCAQEMGADAVVNVCYSTATMHGVAEILAYGTAVKYK